MLFFNVNFVNVLIVYVKINSRRVCWGVGGVDLSLKIVFKFVYSNLND